MRILVTGASGFIGRHVVKLCLQRGYQVRACMRRNRAVARSELTTVAVDFDKDVTVDAWLPRLQGIDAVVNCAGIFRESRDGRFDAVHRKAACALFQACAMLGIEKVIQISALGADATAFSQFHLSKKKADDCLSALNVDWTIIRPSIVFGRGAASSAFFKALAALPLTPLPGDGDQLLQPIVIEDLAQLVLRALESQALSRKYVDAVGAETISVKALLSLLKHWLGMPRQRFIAIPFALLIPIVRLLQVFLPSLISMDALNMLKQGSRADYHTLVTLSGVRPRAISAELSSDIASASDVSDCKLYFLYPLLRISLALLWIFSGYVSAFVYPYPQSLAMLTRLAISPDAAPWLLYTAAALDIVLGMALLINYRVRLVLGLQIFVMLVYSVLISLGLPKLWWHPFAPLAKNLPLIVCSLLLLSREKQSWNC